MDLVFPSSSLSFFGPEKLVSCVGNQVLLFLEKEILSKHSVFPNGMRIEGHFFNNDHFFVYAENLIKIFHYDEKFQNLLLQKVIEFPDWITKASYGIDNELIVVLRHSQIYKCSYEGTMRELGGLNPKIITSAKICDFGVFLGDSFGNLSLFNYQSDSYFEINIDHGSVFSIDYNPETKEIMAAHEYFHVSLWMLNDDYTFKLLWIHKSHQSRVWGVKFIMNRRFSYGEDGCLRYHDDSNRYLLLHRAKNITALATKGTTVVTAGQDCILQRFDLVLDAPIIRTFNQMSNDISNSSSTIATPVASLVLSSGESIVSYNDGRVLSYPDQRLIFDPDPTHVWFILSSYRNICIGVSRKFSIFIYIGNSVNFFLSPKRIAITGITINDRFIGIIYADRSLYILDHIGSVLLNISISEYFIRAPVAIGISDTFPSLTIGSSSSQVFVFDFNDDFSSIQKVTRIKSSSNSGFNGIVYSGKTIYCAGRLDGMISIVSQIGENWVMKSSWQIPSCFKSIIGIEENSPGSIIVSASNHNEVALWDISTQTTVGMFFIDVKKSKVSLSVNSNSYSVIWYDSSNVYYIERYPIIERSISGVPFHGLRGLFGMKYHDVLITGSCDRDIRIWSVNGQSILCNDYVQSVDSGTHAMSIGKNDILFSGGSQQELYIWKLIDKKLFFNQIIDLTPFLVVSKCKRRIVSITAFDEYVYVGMSDAQLLKLRYSNDELSIVEKHELVGVPMSMDYCMNRIIIGTSNGFILFVDGTISQFPASNSGIHSVKAIETTNNELVVFCSCDDGTIQCINPKCNIINEVIHNSSGIKAFDVEKFGEKNVQIAVFSYDQKVSLITYCIESGKAENQISVTTNVPYGESVAFFGSGVIAFGNGIQYIDFF